MNHDQFVQIISGKNLSQAWANALMKCYEASGKTLSPAIVHFPVEEQDGKIESLEIREILDKHIADPSKFIQSAVESVAGTIFPESIWRRSRGNRQIFYEKYEAMLPYIRRKRANMRGVYFQRMIAYPGDGENKIVNQLEHVITTWQKGNHRRSALQAGIFDPRSDHSNAPLQGFPCLQQIAFNPKGSNGKDGLEVVAFYANQTLMEKAYGNYLGLYRLGQFMAREMGLKLKNVVCIASALKLNNNLDKNSCEPLVNAIKAVLKNAEV